MVGQLFQIRSFRRCDLGCNNKPKEAADVARARQTAEKVRADLEALNAQLEKEVAQLDTAFDAQTEELEEIVVRAKATDIHVPVVALAWMPYSPDSKGRLRPAWG